MPGAGVVLINIEIVTPPINLSKPVIPRHGGRPLVYSSHPGLHQFLRAREDSSRTTNRTSPLSAPCPHRFPRARCGNSEVAGLVASTHVSTHEILRARVATGSRRPQDHVLQDQPPHVVEGRHVQPPLVKFPGFVMEASLPQCGDGGEVKLVHIPAGEDGKRRFGHGGLVAGRGPGGLPVDSEWTPEKGRQVTPRLHLKKAPVADNRLTPEKGGAATGVLHLKRAGAWWLARFRGCFLIAMEPCPSAFDYPICIC